MGADLDEDLLIFLDSFEQLEAFAFPATSETWDDDEGMKQLRTRAENLAIGYIYMTDVQN